VVFGDNHWILAGLMRLYKSVRRGQASFLAAA
jgi:hypothetical protein